MNLPPEIRRAKEPRPTARKGYLPRCAFAPWRDPTMRGSKKSPRKPATTRAKGGGRTFDVINPATGKVAGTYPITSRAQVRTVVERARDAFRGWAKKDPEDRGVFLVHFAEILRKHKDDYAT